MALIGTIAALFVAAFLVPGVNTFFELEDWPPAAAVLQAVGYGAAASAVIWTVSRVVSRHPQSTTR